MSAETFNAGYYSADAYGSVEEGEYSQHHGDYSNTAYEGGDYDSEIYEGGAYDCNSQVCMSGCAVFIQLYYGQDIS